MVGHRDTATFTRLYDKIKHLKECRFFTDDGDAFARVLPPDRHILGKLHTIAIEQDNSNTRRHLARMTRRTKVVTHCEAMIDTSLKLWSNLTQPDIFSRYQSRFISIFR